MPVDRGIEKWSDSCYILKIELTGCAEGQAVGRRGRENSRMTSRPLRTRKVESPLIQMRKAGEKQVLGENQEFSFRQIECQIPEWRC